MRWRFDPTQAAFGVPPGRVADIHVFQAPPGVTLATLHALEATSALMCVERAQTVLVDLAPGIGGDGTPFSSDLSSCLILVLRRLSARLARGESPEFIAHQGTPDFHELVLQRVLTVGAGMPEVRVIDGGRAKFWLYPPPVQADRAFLLIRDGGKFVALN